MVNDLLQGCGKQSSLPSLALTARWLKVEASFMSELQGLRPRHQTNRSGTPNVQWSIPILGTVCFKKKSTVAVAARREK